MKCKTCGYDNPENMNYCGKCGGFLGATIASRIRKAIKVWLVGGLMGAVTGLSFILVHDVLTKDRMFDLWEFVVALVVPLLMAIFVALATRSRIGILLSVAFLTFLMPVCGASFGASGSEPLWQFAAMGLIGGLFWSIPFAIWQLMKGKTKP